MSRPLLVNRYVHRPQATEGFRVLVIDLTGETRTRATEPGTLEEAWTKRNQEVAALRESGLLETNDHVARIEDIRTGRMF